MSQVIRMQFIRKGVLVKASGRGKGWMAFQDSGSLTAGIRWELGDVLKKFGVFKKHPENSE